MKTSELTGAALDWAVAKCEVGELICEIDDPHFYSTNWAIGGPIIERERIEIDPYRDGWRAIRYMDKVRGKSIEQIRECGPTPLIAVMRCFVASKLGDEVEIPIELK